MSEETNFDSLQRLPLCLEWYTIQFLDKKSARAFFLTSKSNWKFAHPFSIHLANTKMKSLFKSFDDLEYHDNDLHQNISALLTLHSECIDNRPKSLQGGCHASMRRDAYDDLQYLGKELAEISVPTCLKHYKLVADTWKFTLIVYEEAKEIVSRKWVKYEVCEKNYRKCLQFLEKVEKATQEAWETYRNQ